MFSSTRLTTYLVRSARKSLQSRFYCAQAPLEVPQPDGAPKTYPPNITSIVDQISKLTLMEVADLNSCLKTTLNIQDAPMMAMGMPMTGQAAAPQQAEEEESAPKQTLFSVKIDRFDDSKKIALIKEVKKIMEGMNLVQAKKFVESVPVVVKEDLTKEESEELKKVLEAAGATIEVS